MDRKLAKIRVVAFAGLCAALVGAPRADAEDKPPPAWTDTLKFSGYIDAGIMGNTDEPKNGINWGRLFDDRANSPNLNQFALTLTRPTNPNAPGYDFGFTLQAMYGSDARYTHFLGQFARATKARNQFTILEGDVLAHLPWLGEGGIDAKLGEFPSILSAEQTLPSANPFYSHSYIFNYGITVAHTGLLTTTHVNSLVDLYLGVDTGNQTTLTKGGDNNGALAGLAGVGLNFLDGNITVLWLTHFGPENARGAVDLAGRPLDPNSAFRYESTLTTVVKWNDDLTFTTDLNLIRDDGVKADGYGVAQYVAYALTDWATLQFRGEVWRDAQGFFVAAFPGTQDSINLLAGRPNTAIPGVSTTYGALTLGVNLKPPVPERFTGTVFRPELRYDTTLNNAHPFKDFTKSSQLTIGADLILPF